MQAVWSHTVPAFATTNPVVANATRLIQRNLAHRNLIKIRDQISLISSAGNYQYVRVCELLPEVPDKEISLVLGKYGNVKRVLREKFPVEMGLDIFNGVRGVYMDVKSEIPSALHFLNWRGNIFYSGNKDKCFICNQKGHQMNACPKKRNKCSVEVVQDTQPVTYAGVLKEVASAQNGKVVEHRAKKGSNADNTETQVENVEMEEQETAPGHKSDQVPIRMWRYNGKLYTQYDGTAEISVEDETEKQKKRDLEVKACRSTASYKDKKQRSSSRLSSIGSKSYISD